MSAPLSQRQLRDWLVMLPTKTRARSPADVTRDAVAIWLSANPKTVYHLGTGNCPMTEEMQHRLSALVLAIQAERIRMRGGELVRCEPPAGQPVPVRATMDASGPVPRIIWGSPWRS